VTASAVFPAPHISLMSLTRDDSVRPARVVRSRARPKDSVLARVAQGDAVAARECVDQFGGLIWSIARRYSASQADAQEAVREIFADVWRSAVRFDPAQGAERIFVATIARRRLIDRMRHGARRDLAKVQPLLWFDMDGSPDACTEAVAASRAVMQLRPELQRVLELAVLQGLSHAEIADLMQVAPGTVKTMLYRGLIQVRELMGKQGLNVE
jgi:RNA polymerase sigma-70 factor, ECF subfamily